MFDIEGIKICLLIWKPLCSCSDLQFFSFGFGNPLFFNFRFKNNRLYNFINFNHSSEICTEKKRETTLLVGPWRTEEEGLALFLFY
jgi:hypothetical protein